MCVIAGDFNSKFARKTLDSHRNFGDFFLESSLHAFENMAEKTMENRSMFIDFGERGDL